jgi:hypothetical protein
VKQAASIAVQSQTLGISAVTFLFRPSPVHETRSWLTTHIVLHYYNGINHHDTYGTT